ncbi:DNA-binding ATP-dependent protease La [Legionella sainthelensi]|uniref:Lon protease n=1 Tax=Legionella sainthelensi TaxID=28087 RepID=A0A0W0YJW8_9GAMM|nr:endopeptidase La [Legionella sainthelensi]KTD56910.1 DNA-binding ATP-dependent protease La [Legionella sainthelensi]VEH37161.1 DNA-binding ATP-dependent protease La [Legionella sainthelensi]
MEIQANKEKAEQQAKELSIPSELPILTLRGAVIYPLTVMPLNVGQSRSIKLAHDVTMSSSRFIGIMAIKNNTVGEPSPIDIYKIGTASVIHRLIHLSDNSVQLIVRGIEKICIKEFTSVEPYFKARIELTREHDTKNKHIEALMRNTIDLLRHLISLTPHLSEDLFTLALNTNDPRQLVYLIAANFRLELKNAQELLELDKVEDKLIKLNMFLTREIEIIELGKKIQSQAQNELDKTERYFMLREQLRQIKKELGEEDEQVLEIREYENKITQAQMSDEAEKEAIHELNRMKTMPISAAEYQVTKTYLDWLVELPWNKATEDNLDINSARKILDEDHYDLQKVKERILEYLAVHKLRLERNDKSYTGSILCFVGPPGVGKTSLGQSIARALSRKFIRFSLGGMHDEGEIRGHRRTYIGALPGRIIQSIKRIQSRNPVMMLDEIDKVGADFRGDPSSALLEVLDPAQNNTFCDHYLDVDFDLSQVIFICTANQLDPIQPALRDRMEIITLPGYTDDEKLHIAINYLIPRQIKENGLMPEEIQFEHDAILLITHDYTREAGVRNLEREIGAICRKVATLIAEKKAKSLTITPDKVIELLGKPKYYSEIAERTTIPGVAIGLAVTVGGGDILFIEATKMPGSKGFTVTGQLGTVMKESAQAALSYVRSKAHQLGIDDKEFEKSDIHLHIPEGAIPKDGPSAGVTMATALASLMTNRFIKSEVGMTGEITLRGRVLPVGGIKEKVLAAHRAGLKTVILPKRNDKDLEDLPDKVCKEMKFIFAKNVSEVFDAALCPAKKNDEGAKQ